jgi:hypothetical protein
MLVDELEIIVYPKRGRWRSEITKRPTWKQIEAAIRALDRHGHPFLKLFLSAPKVETELRSLQFIGGDGEYGIMTFDSKYRQLQWYCDPSRPDGPDLVPIWTSDQGADFVERYLCNKLSTILRVAKHFAKTGMLDPAVRWEDWPPPRLRPPEQSRASQG